MPRTPTRRVAPTPANSSVVLASAARLNAASNRNVPRRNPTTGDWQDEAWEHYDICGELQSGIAWKANALSQVILTIHRKTPDGEVEVTDPNHPAVQMLSMLYDGPEGQAEMMRSLGTHLGVPGEAYLVGLPADDEKGRMADEWLVLSTREVRKQGNTWQIERGDGVTETYNDDEVMVLRIWRPHPAKYVEATSSVRAALPVLRTIRSLNMRIDALLDSRIAGNGLLIMSNEATFTPVNPTQPGVDPETPVEGGGSDNADTFMQNLAEAMITPMTDRGHPSAVVPAVVRVPKEVVEHVKHLKFYDEMTSEERELMAAWITRLAIALDEPPEVLTGLAQANHWSGWLISEEGIKTHINPDVGIIVDAFTRKFIWPGLQEMGYTDWATYSVHGDTSPLRERPNKSMEARELHAAFKISDAALLRETGFDEADVPDPEELEKRLVLHLAQQAGTPEAAVAALQVLGVTLPIPAPAVQAPAEPRALPAPEPAVDVEERRDPPALVAAGSREEAALLAACEVIALRAIERGWNRAGKRRGPRIRGQQAGTVRRTVAPDDLDAALAGAWDTVPRPAAALGLDADRLIAALDHYARGVLSTGADHNDAAFARLLRERVLTPAVAVGA